MYRGNLRLSSRLQATPLLVGQLTQDGRQLNNLSLIKVPVKLHTLPAQHGKWQAIPDDKPKLEGGREREHHLMVYGY